MRRRARVSARRRAVETRFRCRIVPALSKREGAPWKRPFFFVAQGGKKRKKCGDETRFSRRVLYSYYQGREFSRGVARNASPLARHLRACSLGGATAFGALRALSCTLSSMLLSSTRGKPERSRSRKRRPEMFFCAPRKCEFHENAHFRCQCPT